MRCQIKNFVAKYQKLFENGFRFADQLGNRFFVEIALVKSLADLDLTFDPHHDCDVGLGIELVT